MFLLLVTIHVVSYLGVNFPLKSDCGYISFKLKDEVKNCFSLWIMIKASFSSLWLRISFSGGWEGPFLMEQWANRRVDSAQQAGDHAHRVPGTREERSGPLESRGAQSDPQREEDVRGDGWGNVLVLPSSVWGRRRKAKASSREAECGMGEIRNCGQSPARRSKYRHPRFIPSNLNRLLNRVSSRPFSFFVAPRFLCTRCIKKGRF